MRRIVATLLICTAILSSCKSKKESTASKYLNAANLKEQLFTIDIHKDTNLITQQGLKIRIDANSIDASTPTVTIEVKEALNLEDMLTAGLTTLSNKGILSSDGMFHIATKEESSIKKPIGISLPTAAANKDMQLYKGKEEDGQVIWEEPEKISILKNKEADGESLYKLNCASCHDISRKVTGPELAWIENRWPDRDALRAYIKNPAAFMWQPEAADSLPTDTTRFSKYRQYAACLTREYGSLMTAYEGMLNDKEIDAIINYINHQSKNSGLPQSHKKMDSCYKYGKIYEEMMSKRDSLVQDNGKMVEIDITPPADQDPNSDNNDFGEIPKVFREEFPAEYYQFQIQAYGWYNVDDLFMEKFNSQLSELSVDVKGDVTGKVNTYLVIPSLKVFIPGGKLANGQLGFFTVDGKLPLPQGYEAYIIALSEANGKTYFGKERFTTSLSASYTLDVKEMSPEKIMRQMKRLRLGEFEFKVEKTRNFNSIQQLDQEAKAIREKAKDCPCMNMRGK